MKYKYCTCVRHLRNPLTLNHEVVTEFPCVATVTVLERLCTWETDTACHLLIPCHFKSQPNQIVPNLRTQNWDKTSDSPRGSQGPCTEILSLHSVLERRPSNMHIPLCSFKQKAEFWFSQRVPPVQQESPGIFSSGISEYENWGSAWLNGIKLMSKAWCVNTDSFILECWELCPVVYWFACSWITEDSTYTSHEETSANSWYSSLELQCRWWVLPWCWDGIFSADM